MEQHGDRSSRDQAGGSGDHARTAADTQKESSSEDPLETNYKFRQEFKKRVLKNDTSASYYTGKV